MIINRFIKNKEGNGIEGRHLKIFTRNLLSWNRLENNRSMPWKGENDPYKIWLSEIILQQTRVEQGLEYYNNYIKKYPTIKKLASARDTEVYKLWEGLGYYNRCRNLLITARYIAAELKGQFPDKYESILKLKGVGPYTAAAIASFAFNLPYAVVDGNVMRVLSRYFGIEIPADSVAGKTYFTTLANKLLQKDAPAIFNQAIMDFGATVCKPKNPDCKKCPMNKNCLAFNTDAIDDYPVKGKRPARQTRWFYYVVASFRNQFYIRKRTGKDIWHNLHEFILIESDSVVDDEQLHTGNAFRNIIGNDFRVSGISATYNQVLTHQFISGKFIRVELLKKKAIKGYELVTKDRLSKLAFPVFIINYFKAEGYNLTGS